MTQYTSETRELPRIRVKGTDFPWLEAKVVMTTKTGNPGIIVIDEGVPVPFGVVEGFAGQVICVFENDGVFTDLHHPHRRLEFQAAAEMPST